jgi:hypothetical protein
MPVPESGSFLAGIPADVAHLELPTMDALYDHSAGKAAKLVGMLRLARHRSREGNLGVPRQLGEMAVLWLRNGVRPSLYLAAGLYRRELSWEQKLEFIGNGLYYRMIEQINPKSLRFLTNNKIVAHGYLSRFGIPTAEFYGFIDRVHGVTFDNRPLRTAADLEGLLRRIGGRRVCFKLISGLRGEGFLKVSPALDDDPPSVVIEPKGERASIAALWDDVLQAKRYMGYFCEEAIEQHPDAARFHPESLNTIRSWMYRLPDGRWDMFGAVLRMGIGGNAVDNLCQGGIGPWIDVDTGLMHAAIDNFDANRPTFAVHPTTGVVLEGATVPMWDRIVELCVRTCDVMPFFHLLAVDVAIGVDGPLITEIESTPDPHQIGFDKGMGPIVKRLARERRAAR